jgi:DNA-binding MarR family transcriptional regulator
MSHTHSPPVSPPVRDEAAMRQYVEHMARVLADWGLPRMASRVIWALMCADERTLTASELAERIGVSPAAISGALRYAMQIQMVVREPVPGSRRDRYRLVDDSWYEVTIAKMNLIKDLASAAEQGVVLAGGPATPAGARLAGMRDFYVFVQESLPEMLEKWAERKASRRNSA